MATYDVGDEVAFTLTTVDADGAAAASSTVVLTITLPDDTTTTPSVSNPSTGTYTATYTPTQAGLHQVRWTATGGDAVDKADVDGFNVLASDWTPVVSLAAVKQHLNITSTTQDDELRRLVAVAAAVGERVTGRVFGRKTVTAEKHDGGRESIVLREVPVLSVTTVVEDGDTLTSSDYALSPTGSGVLTRVSSGVPQTWEQPGEKQTVSVTYEAGYVEQPANDVLGAMKLIRHLWEDQRGSQTAQFTQGDQFPQAFVPSYSIPRAVRELWEPDIVPGIA